MKPTLIPTDALKTFDFGKLEGQKQTNEKNKSIHNAIINSPNLPMAGEGESWNDAVGRVIPTLENIVNNAPANTTLVTHNSVFGLINLWDKEGRPSEFSKDARVKYTKQDNKFKTGDHFVIEGANGPIIITRHGQTSDNIAGNFRRSDTELTPEGIKQAKTLGKQLSKYDIPEIISSPLDRTIDTSNIILEQQKKKEYGGWLEKYSDGGRLQEHQENYNESNASVGPGFVGMSNNTQGRHYSPAWGGQFAMGGSLPGAVGFSYARTQGIPSEGPKGKKTIASAENGIEMKFYQQGLDYLPKTISKNGRHISQEEIDRANSNRQFINPSSNITSDARNLEESLRSDKNIGNFINDMGTTALTAGTEFRMPTNEELVAGRESWKNRLPLIISAINTGLENELLGSAVEKVVPIASNVLSNLKKSNLKAFASGAKAFIDDIIVAPEIAAKNRAERMLAQQNKWSTKNMGSTKQSYKDIEKYFSVEPSSNYHYSPSSLGVKSGDKAVLFSDAPLTPSQQKYIASHETGHFYSNSPEESSAWLNNFNTDELSRYLRGRPMYALSEEGMTKPGILIDKGRQLSSGNADEIRERAAQLKDWIAYKKNIPLNKDFEVTAKDLNDAIKNYSKSTGLDNNMTQMLSALKDKKGFLKEMNAQPLGIVPIIGAAAVQRESIPTREFKNGGWLSKYDNNGNLLRDIKPEVRESTKVVIPPSKRFNQEEYNYYHPRTEKIRTGYPIQVALYNNQWLFDTPIIGNILRNKAKEYAINSGGAEYITNDAPKEEYSGSTTSGPVKTNLVNQYFDKSEGLTKSKYIPKSDYLSFLPSYSIKKEQVEKQMNKDGKMIDLIRAELYPNLNPHYSIDAPFDFDKDEQYQNFINNKGTIYNNRDMPSTAETLLNVNLAGHKTGMSWDKSIDLPYTSVSDAWDFEPTSYSKKWGESKDQEDARQLALVQSALMHKAGYPFKIYDRFYFNPNTREYIPDDSIQSIKKSKGITPIQDEATNKDYSKFFQNDKQLTKYDEGGEIEDVPVEDEFENPKNRPEGFFRQMFQESSGNINLKKKGKPIRSKVGALGAFQIMPNVYKDYQQETGDKEPFESVNKLDKAALVRDWYINKIAEKDWIKNHQQSEEARKAKIYGSFFSGPERMKQYMTDLKTKGVNIYKDANWADMLPTGVRDYINNIVLNKNPEFQRQFNEAMQKNPNLLHFKKHVKGGSINLLDENVDKQLNDLLNFTNNPQKNWLEKYQ